MRVDPKSWWCVLMLGLLVVSAPSLAQTAPTATLPLADYFELRSRALARDTALRTQEAPATLLRQHTAVRLEPDGVTLEQELEIEARDGQSKPLALHSSSSLREIEVEARAGATRSDAVLLRTAEGLQLLATRAGRYIVRLRDTTPLSANGRASVALPRALAPLATATLDLPADLEWSVPGALVADERVDAGRRRVALLLGQDQQATLEARHTVAVAQQSSAVVRALVITHIEIGTTSVTQHDVVIYEVLRGELSRFEVRLPPGRQLDRAWIADGEVEDHRASTIVATTEDPVVRTAALHLESTLPLSATASGIPLAPVEPTVQVRTRYFVVTSAQPVDLRVSHPVAASPIDLLDPPAVLRKELERKPPLAGWRFESVLPEGLLLHAKLWPSLEAALTPMPQRATRTFVGAEGSVLHRDRYTLSGERTAFSFALPPALELESVEVGGKTVRPVEREGRYIVPVPYGSDETIVEVVATEKRSLPQGRRSETWKLALPDPEARFLAHTWEVRIAAEYGLKAHAGDLLPAAYMAAPVSGRGNTGFNVSARDLDRFNSASPESAWAVDEVRPVQQDQAPSARDPWAVLQQTPGVQTDRVNVGANESGQQSTFVSPGGGVRISRPEVETPPALLLVAALPPAKVEVELEIARLRK